MSRSPRGCRFRFETRRASGGTRSLTQAWKEPTTRPVERAEKAEAERDRFRELWDGTRATAERFRAALVEITESEGTRTGATTANLRMLAARALNPEEGS